MWEKRRSKVKIVQAFDWLSSYLVYCLCMVECGCIGQKLIQCKWVEFYHLVYNIFIKTMTNGYDNCKIKL